jgi:predicted permease
VKHAAFASVTPFSGSWDQNSVRVEGYTARQDEDVSPSFATVTPEYFATVGIRLVRGRLFTERDTEASRKVAVVNETMARYFFGDRDPVGRTFEVERNVPIEIVGVVGDSKYVDPREELTRFVYLPLAQSWFNDLTLLVRTGGSTSQAAVLIRETLRALDPRVPLGEITTLDAQFDRALAMERVLAWMTSAFGALAMVLTGVGLYGVLAYSVASRTQEIGVRLALGARPADIGRMIARSTALLVAGGLLVGGMAAAVATQVLSGLLYGLSPSDPVTIGLAVGMVTGVTALAAAFPARHASRVDPVVALR